MISRRGVIVGGLAAVASAMLPKVPEAAPKPVLRAYRVDDCDTVAAYSPRHAIDVAADIYGWPSGEAAIRDGAYHLDVVEEADPATPVWADEARTQRTTIGAILRELEGPDHICSTEY